MSKTVFDYEIPFIGRVTMPRKATWMCDRLGEPCEDLKAEMAAGGPIHWDYAKHGRLGWMQFFYDWRFADLTGDGTIGFILLCGTFRQTAYHQDGRILWNYENPEGSLLDIRFDSNCPVCDIDGDGVSELITPRKIQGELRLCVICAATGRLKKSIPYPQAKGLPDDPQFGHLRSSITVVNASGSMRPGDIIVFWDYRSITLLDRNLNHLWTRRLEEMPARRHRVFGHTPHAADINADGFDEILAGSVLLSRHGEVMWVAPDLP
ncbi:MAG TPA: hypothetical protein VLH60_01475, partial [Sedimentisphaerales bacterium]|nr:hypothetical protein [Sedimentisphaerales bacterium]